MDKIEAQKRMLEIEKAYLSGQQSREEANKAYKALNKEIQKSTKMDKQEKKELAHKIIKIILEVLLQIITCGLPALLSGGKTILNHKK